MCHRRSDGGRGVNAFDKVEQQSLHLRLFCVPVPAQAFVETIGRVARMSRPEEIVLLVARSDWYRDHLQRAFPNWRDREGDLQAMSPSLLDEALGAGKVDARERVIAMLPRHGERMTQAGGTLSGGEQQMLAVGRALMSKPRLLVLDEPSTGLAPLLAKAVYESLAVLRKRGLTVLVTEQQVPLAMAFSDRGYVLENGFIRLEGTTEQLAANPAIRSAYLGVT